VPREHGWIATISGEVRVVRRDRKALRRFGLTMAVALGVLGALLLLRGRSGCLSLGCAAAFLGAGIVAPLMLRPVHKVWMTLAIVLGWAMTRVILAAVFYAGVTPVALLGRLFGRRFLDLGFEPGRKSYWEPKPRPSTGVERYERQF
jgi:hypothetical protein